MHIRLKSFVLFLTMFGTFFSALTPAFADEQIPFSQRIVVVDAGHGGPDSGARGVNSIHEKDITLAVSRKLADLLRESGAIVIETRQVDTDLSTDLDKQLRKRHRGDLKGRLGIARKTRIDAFISVHCNAGPSPEWRGAQVLYLEGNEDAKKLAEITQDTFKDELLPTKREIESNRTLYLLKRIEGPAILAEIGFVTNPDEAAHMIRHEYQAKIASALYVSLLKYFDEEGHEDVTPSENP